MGPKGSLLIAAMLLCLPSVLADGQPRVDPQTGVIRLLFIGDSMLEPGNVAPFIVQDPMIAMTPIPFTWLAQVSAGGSAERMLRQYFPRREKDIYERYDVIILTEANIIYFPTKVQNWIKAGVVEHGLGFLMAGGPNSFGGFGPWELPGWDGSIVEEAMPVRCLTDWTYDLHHLYHLVPAPGREDHPLVRKIPWEQVHLSCRNRVEPKEGAVVVGVSDKYPPGSPILTYLEIGEGLSEAFVYDWGGNGPKDFHRWDYVSLVMSNLIYYPARVPIPEDTSTFLRLRTQLNSYYSMRRFVMSVMDFAEKFGANLNQAEELLRKSDEGREEVIALYLSGDHQSSMAALESALSSLEGVSQLAMRAKDQALFWVYVIEWFTVSGTAMVCGVVVWTLMVRRALYRDIGVTRFLK